MTSTILIALAGTSAIFIAKEIFVKRRIKKKTNIKDNITDKELLSLLGKTFKADIETFDIGNDVIKQGDRVSFYATNEEKMIQGDFIGIKKSEAIDYEDLFIVRIGEGKVKQKPMELIKMDTLQKFSR